MFLSVIICTHNPRPDYFRRTLDSLQEQTLPRSQWELLVVDNASTKSLSESWNFSWHPGAHFVSVPELGLTPARLRGIQESSGSLLVFVDDDNVLSPDFLEKICRIAEQNPHLSVFGAGVLEPEFETPPAPELVSLLPLLALRKVSSVRWSNNPKDASCLPCGAGLAVTRATAEYYLQLTARLNFSKMLDRRGGQLTSHGDDLFSWAAADLGQGFGIFPELRITHLISAGRLTRPYFLRLIEGSAFSHWILNYLLDDSQPKRTNFFRRVHIALHGLRNGRFSMQCHQASARGENSAARFVAENSLRPVKRDTTKLRSLDATVLAS